MAVDRGVVMAYFPFVIFAAPERKEEKHNKTQRRKDAKTQRSLFQLYRASASSVPERRQVGAGFGKHACLSLCLPFGFRLRLPLADRAGGSPVGPGWGQSRREPGCTRSVLRQEGSGRHELVPIQKVGLIHRGSRVGNELAHGDCFPPAESGRSPRLPGSNTVRLAKTFAPSRLCVFALNLFSQPTHHPRGLWVCSVLLWLRPRGRGESLRLCVNFLLSGATA